MSNTENRYTETDLGNVAPNPRGEYDPAAAYEYLDLVEYGGGSYLCIQESGTVTGVAPTQNKNTDTWQVLTIPGDLTAEYIAMHDDVVNKAESAQADAASTAADREQVESMFANVEQLHTQTETAAQEASDSRDSAAGYAAAAEASRTAAADSEKNAQLQVTGFNETVNAAKQEASEEIATARKTAVQAVAAQQVKSVNAVNVAGNATIEKTSADAKDAKDAKEAAVSAANAAEDGAREATAAAEQAENDKQSAETAAAAAKTSAAAAETAQKAVEGAAGQIETNTAGIEALKEDLGNIIYKGLINGFDKDNTVDGYLSNNGNVNSNPGFVTSDYFDVHENKAYYALQMVGTVKYDTVAYICFYDSSKAFIAGGYFNASSCTSPNGSKYARVSFPSDETTKARCMFTNIENPDKYYPFGYEYSIITKDVSELKTRKSENRLHGKTMAILGDSMAKGHTLNEKQTWAYKIANRNGMTYQKLAVNGMFITTGHGDADANCLLEQAKKINNNPDIIVIHMGTNDRNNNVELGTWTSGNTDTTNLFGALRAAFTYLAENFPLAQVMFITPYYYQEQTDYIGSIEKACMYVGCHCKNNKQGGIWAWNTNVRNALFLDYVHLNEVGQERVSYEYEGFMRTFM